MSMKTENSALLKKLRQYSALAAPLFATAGFASGQVVYHDYDPDRILTGSNPPDTMHIDLNNDGTSDFIFFALTYSNDRNIGLEAAGFAGTSNAIAGTTIVSSTPGGGAGPILHPYAFNAGKVIDENLPWFKRSQLIFQSGVNSADVFFYPAMNSFYNGQYFGNWLDGGRPLCSGKGSIRSKYKLRLGAL